MEATFRGIVCELWVWKKNKWAYKDPDFSERLRKAKAVWKMQSVRQRKKKHERQATRVLLPETTGLQARCLLCLHLLPAHVCVCARVCVKRRRSLIESSQGKHLLMWLIKGTQSVIRISLHFSTRPLCCPHI